MSRHGSWRAGLGAVLLAGGACLAGCASTPAPAWHTLVPAAATAGSAPTAADRVPLTVAIGAVSLPDEVDRAQLVLRGTGGVLAVLDGERWAEPLKSQLPRAIALALGQRLPGAVVVAEPNLALAQPAWRVAIDVQRFELQRAAPDQALLRVVWALRPGFVREGGEPPAAAAQLFEVAVPAQGGSTAALVAAMAAAVVQLSGQIARQLCPAGACQRIPL